MKYEALHSIIHHNDLNLVEYYECSGASKLDSL